MPKPWADAGNPGSTTDGPPEQSGSPWAHTPLGEGPAGYRGSHIADGFQQQGSGVAVGSWVPFANYLNTQAPQMTRNLRRDPAPAPELGPEGGPGGPPKPQGTPVDQTTATPQGGGGNGLVAGPGLGGFYGQLSQQYLTGKRQ